LISLSERYEQVESKIQSACERSGRLRSEVELIVVTKNHPVDLALELYELGQRNFGENKDQEASQKAKDFELQLPAGKPRWHFIGQLQSNKAKSVIRYAASLHSLDRLSLLKELNKQLDTSDSELSVFIELNLTGDANRGGISPAGLAAFAQEVLDSPRLRLQGLMAVAGLGVDPKLDFERAREASLELQKLSPNSHYLSMGMSEDYQVAIDLGATHIRVGSAITGPRPQSA
jgi:pyridoxal phosphate enzyme (YggS family)